MSVKKTVNLKVNGIHCNGCATKIKNSLNSLNSDLATDVNIESGNVKVVYDSEKAGLSEIKAKITDVGFQVESVELE